jgi:leucyl/phenylalanyl-tRNA---protein transferase
VNLEFEDCPNIPWMDPHHADEQGLVGIGGSLRPSCLVRAYRDGVFPWYGEGDPILWWSPDPRAIFELDRFHISRRLARTVRSAKFQVTIDRDFRRVMRACGEERLEGTWITPEMLAAYEDLHRLGVAHSVETWQDGELVGGLYGVSLGAFFAAESMFHRRTDASKVALVHLIAHLKKRRFQLLDSQIINDHTRSLGATEISRTEYLYRLRYAIRNRDVSF